jgi:hypothetical protein
MSHKIFGINSVVLGPNHEAAKLLLLRSDPDVCMIFNPSMTDADWTLVRALKESGQSVIVCAHVEHAPPGTAWIAPSGVRGHGLHS